jgi:acyl-CoA hydrolase
MNTYGSYSERYRELLASADDVARRIQSGDVIVVSGGASQPFAFLEALARRRDLQRVTLLSAMALLPPDLLVRQYQARRLGELPEAGVRCGSFWVGPGEKLGAQAGVLDVIPVDARYLGRLLGSRRVDVVVVGSAGMDDQGNFNLGCNVDWMPDLLAAAEARETLVVAEVNPHLPWTEGETTFRIEPVDYVIESRHPVPDLPCGDPMPEAPAVGGFLATLVPNESTLQVGMGDLPAQAVPSLDAKVDLGVHSDFIGDALLHLHSKGSLTCRKKGHLTDRWVGSFVLGSRQLYDFVNRNPLIALHPADVVAQPATIMRNRRMVSITQAIAVELTGQVVGESGAFDAWSGGGMQHAFHWAAANSDRGMGIVVLPSTVRSSRKSNIVSAVPPGAAVTVPRTSADVVVTEHGVARLKGRTLQERALNLIAVAHPEHRDRLLFDAKQLGLLQ